MAAVIGQTLYAGNIRPEVRPERLAVMLAMVRALSPKPIDPADRIKAQAAE